MSLRRNAEEEEDQTSKIQANQQFQDRTVHGNFLRKLIPSYTWVRSQAPRANKAKRWVVDPH